MISIVTATFNRVKELEILYDSLARNYIIFKDFEWIVIDDGSTDDTKEQVLIWQKKSPFKVVYYYQENMGKMRAINKGMEFVTGELVLELDSDDYLGDEALLTIVSDYNKIVDKSNIYGLLYRRKIDEALVNELGTLDNKTLKLFDVHNTYGYDFDMTLVFISEIRKKFSYELIEDEKFITEARLYYKMDSLYESLVFKNKEVVFGEYLPDGYSNNIKEIFLKYPKGYYEFFKECLGYVSKKTLWKKRIYFIKHLILFGYLCGKSKKEVISDTSGMNKILVRVLIGAGYSKSKRYIKAD